MQRDDGHAATWTRDRVLFAAAELLFVIATLAMLSSGANILVGCSGEGRRAAAPGDAGARAPSDARAQAAWGAPDAGSPDAGSSDAGSRDAGSSDAGSSDAGSRDAGVRVRRTGRFFQHADAPIRTALANQAIASVERGRGGRSLSFRVTLEDGTAGYFKPEQSFSGMKWYSEVAAYHLDRELGLGRVAPVVSRRVAWSELEEAAQGDPRVSEIAVDDEGFVRGAMIWWVPSRPTVLPLEAGWEGWLRIDGVVPRVTPYQPADDYRRGVEITPPEALPDPDLPARPAELSDLMVFDYLIHNGDRWGTSNVNVRTLGPGGPLMFLDNAAGFAMRRPRVGQMDARLEHVQRFRRSTIDAIRAFDVERYRKRLGEEALGPILDDVLVRHLMTRRAHLLAHVDALVAQHGAEAVYFDETPATTIADADPRD
ncbi:MAG: hypothetical protein IT378_24485 [Sandaracinaceae bacterium]|nr:hypothetical protein [Sandaracinaceae bacterium]